MLDFLGREYGVGDTVVYPAGSGRSITMVLAEVVEIRVDGTVSVQPSEAARWTQHHGHDYYVDTRTGKRIDPFVEDGRHYATPPGHRNTKTGEVLTSEAYEARKLTSPGFYQANGGWMDWEYESPTFKSYIEQRHEGPKPVTIRITRNIVRVEKPAEYPPDTEGDTDAR